MIYIVTTTIDTEMERQRRRHRWGNKIGCSTTLLKQHATDPLAAERKGQYSTEEDTAENRLCCHDDVT